jgi:DNA-binding transcriptional ArsR family regulator
MNHTPTDCQRQIVELLRRQQELTVSELVEHLEAPSRVVQRDLKGLIAAGLVVRTDDRVALPSFAAPLTRVAALCALCGCTVRERASFTIINRYGGIIRACCAHCGLLLLDRQPPADIAFTCDFIQERIVDARDAIYLVESRVSACCVPSVISLVNADDARSLQLGFGGVVMSFEALQAFLRQKMAAHDPCPMCANHSRSHS